MIPSITTECLLGISLAMAKVRGPGAVGVRTGMRRTIRSWCPQAWEQEGLVKLILA